MRHPDRDIFRVMTSIRFGLPDYRDYKMNDYNRFKFKDEYKDNHFNGKISTGTINDIKCHMLAGKFDVLKEIE